MQIGNQGNINVSQSHAHVYALASDTQDSRECRVFGRKLLVLTLCIFVMPFWGLVVGVSRGLACMMIVTRPNNIRGSKCEKACQMLSVFIRVLLLPIALVLCCPIGAVIGFSWGVFNGIRKLPNTLKACSKLDINVSVKNLFCCNMLTYGLCNDDSTSSCAAKLPRNKNTNKDLDPSPSWSTKLPQDKNVNDALSLSPSYFTKLSQDEHVNDDTDSSPSFIFEMQDPDCLNYADLNNDSGQKLMSVEEDQVSSEYLKVISKMIEQYDFGSLVKYLNEIKLSASEASKLIDDVVDAYKKMEKADCKKLLELLDLKELDGVVESKDTVLIKYKKIIDELLLPVLIVFKADGKKLAGASLDYLESIVGQLGETGYETYEDKIRKEKSLFIINKFINGNPIPKKIICKSKLAKDNCSLVGPTYVCYKHKLPKKIIAILKEKHDESEDVFMKNVKEIIDISLYDCSTLTFVIKYGSKMETYTLFHAAVAYDNYKLVKICLDLGVYSNVLVDGKTAKDLAKTQEMHELLAQYGAKHAPFQFLSSDVASIRSCHLDQIPLANCR